MELAGCAHALNTTIKALIIELRRNAFDSVIASPLIQDRFSYNVRRLPTCLREEAGEQRDPAPECRHVPSGLSVVCREVLFPAGKARSAAAAIVQLYDIRCALPLFISVGCLRQYH